jgi:hypothetical protein
MSRDIQATSLKNEQKGGFMKEKGYIVAICGYEGYEYLYGIFTLEEAIEFVRMLKKRKTKIARKIMKGYISEQVCLMGPKGDNFELKCMCKLLPEELQNKSSWFM